jgi:AraC-like DNA-binding protein
MSIFPSEILKPYISAYMIFETHVPENYKVVPKPCIVMGIQYKGGLSVMEHGKERKLRAAGITGLTTYTREFRNVPGTGTVLIQFTPHGAARFFDFPVNLISGNSFSLEELTSKQITSDLEEKISLALNNQERIQLIEQFFLSRLQIGKTDKMIEEAVKRISYSSGNIRITELAEALCISQRQFEKRFLRMVGTSPKKFSSLVRLKNVLDQKSFISFTGLALDSGYFDQAHFIKDFKSYLGIAPEQFFKSSDRNILFR